MDTSANRSATVGSTGESSGRGSAGSTSTRPRTSSGDTAASSSEIAPPIELPINTTGSPTTWSRNASSSRRLARTVVARPDAGVRP